MQKGRAKSVGTSRPSGKHHVTHGSAKTSPTRATKYQPPHPPLSKKKKRRSLVTERESNVSSDSHSMHVVPDLTDTVIQPPAAVSREVQPATLHTAPLYSPFLAQQSTHCPPLPSYPTRQSPSPAYSSTSPCLAVQVDKTRQDKTRHKTRQDRTGQERTRQDRTGQDKTRHGTAQQDRTGQDTTRQDRTRQDKTGQDKTKQDRTRQDKTR